MDAGRILRRGLVVGVLCGWAVSAEAAPPWGDLLSLNPVDAEPGKSYQLTEGEGPWMILACSFSGDGAEKQARELAYELRKRYKLPAYTFKGRFDPGEPEGFRRVDKYGRPAKYTYWKYKDLKDEEKERRLEDSHYAVLVGNFRSADDPDAQKVLQKIKYARPQCLDLTAGGEGLKKTNQDLIGWRMIQKQVYEAIGSEKKKLGPMSHAFVTTNPMLPADFFAPRGGVDEDILALNKGVPYSLLDCPGQYTVQVATFKGRVIIKQEEIRAIEEGSKEMKSELAQAAQKADALTKALRKQGVEAYQFHDRYASIVTVGSFNSVGTPRADGRMEINPAIHRIMQQYAPDPAETAKVQEALKVSGMQNQTLAAPVKSLNGIPFDVAPMPVQVPKRSISMAMRDRR